MDSRLKDLLREHHLEVKFLPIKKQGYIIPTPPDQPDILIINQDLSDEEAERVILHEIGHADDAFDIEDYKDNYSVRITSEDFANKYMVKQLVKKYAELGYDISNTNWLDFANSIGTEKYKTVRKELEKYCE